MAFRLGDNQEAREGIRYLYTTGVDFIRRFDLTNFLLGLSSLALLASGVLLFVSATSSEALRRKGTRDDA